MQNEETGLELLMEAGVGKLADIQITKEDIITIAVAKREQDLIEQRNALEEELQSLRQSEEKLEEQLSETIAQEVEAIRPSYDEALAALQACGFKNLKLDIDHEWHVTKTGAKISVSATIMPKRDADDDVGSLTARQNIKPSAEVLRLIKEQESTKQLITAREKLLLAVRRDLGQLGSMERHAKAQVALQLLNGSKAGKQLLAMMERGSAKLLTAKK